MTAFLNFHALAAARGEGLDPKLRLLFERAATSPGSDVAVRHDGFLQSGPDPASETVPERNVSVLPQAGRGASRQVAQTVVERKAEKADQPQFQTGPIGVRV
jgi:hypothetical protein